MGLAPTLGRCGAVQSFVNRFNLRRWSLPPPCEPMHVESSPMLNLTPMERSLAVALEWELHLRRRRWLDAAATPAANNFSYTQTCHGTFKRAL